MRLHIHVVRLISPSLMPQVLSESYTDNVYLFTEQIRSGAHKSQSEIIQIK